MNDLIVTLREAGALSSLDAQMARGLGVLAGETRGDVLLAVALAHRATQNGHVCADLARLAETPLLDEEDRPVAECPPLASWREALLTSNLVSDGATLAPLVLDGRDRLYLRRHWEHEQRLATTLHERALTPIEPADPARLRELALRLFGPRTSTPDWQRIAAQIAAVSSLCVVSGGPGTGKTSTVTKILALSLADVHARTERRPRALLLAPTGKAAARLAEAAAQARAGLDVSRDLIDMLPTEAQTLHRALEVDREGRFRIDASRPLFADVVVVDEASMIDVSMMRRLVDAVPRDSRLVLLGDRNQLSSVEAGAVLSDVCGPSASPRYSSALAARVTRVFDEPLPGVANTSPAGIDDAIVTLTKTWRFAETSALGALAAAVQRGDADAALAVLREGNPEVSLIEPATDKKVDPRLWPTVTAGFGPLLDARTSAEALARLSAFAVLCAHRTGPFGVEECTRTIERVMGEVRGRGGCQHPVLINRNDPELDLYNGDVGVLFKDATDDRGTRAVFLARDGKTRSLSPSRLPPHEPAFAMTVHKSQGSEFDEVVVVLPALGSKLSTRELFYTALTRARRRVVIHGSAAVVREAILHPAVRASGLGDALRPSSGTDYEPRPALSS